MVPAGLKHCNVDLILSWEVRANSRPELRAWHLGFQSLLRDPYVHLQQTIFPGERSHILSQKRNRHWAVVAAASFYVYKELLVLMAKGSLKFHELQHENLQASR